MIEARGLTKKYRQGHGQSTVAVDDLTFTVTPGVVTGFLGPNGAGKSTTMRMIAGLDAPTSGSVTVNGKSYREHSAPLHELGALLEARAVHTGRSALNHLRALAATTGIGRSRVDEVLEIVGLTDVAKRRVGAFSLGMGQRLGIASALLGDPATVMLDEPINGLDPEGILWVRRLLTDLAEEGRTVLVSSHLMSEMAVTAERLIVVGRGRLIRDSSTADFIAGASTKSVVVRTLEPERLTDLLRREKASVTTDEQGRLQVTGTTSDEIGVLAAAAGVTLLELTPVQASLEEAFMELTRDSVEYRSPARPSAIDAQKEIAA